MSFWSSEKLKEILPSSNIISDYDAGNIYHGAYELSMGPEAYISDQPKKYQLKVGDDIIISPGHFAQLLTEESVEIPDRALAFISIKAGIKFRGLVNVSGFHVDPGYSGRLKFSVYNAGNQDIHLARGDKTFLIWLSDFDRKTVDTYKGDSQKRMHLTSADGMLMQGERVSLPTINQKLNSVGRRVTRLQIFMTFILTAIIVPVVVDSLKMKFNGSTEKGATVVPKVQQQPSSCVMSNQPTVFESNK